MNPAILTVIRMVRKIKLDHVREVFGVVEEGFAKEMTFELRL